MSYDDVRGSPDPRQAILDFLDTTYAGVAGLMGWDPELAGR